MQLLYPVALWQGEVPAHEISCMIKGLDGSYLVTGSKSGELCYWKPGAAEDSKVRPVMLPTSPCVTCVLIAQSLCSRGYPARTARLLCSCATAAANARRWCGVSSAPRISSSQVRRCRACALRAQPRASSNIHCASGFLCSDRRGILDDVDGVWRSLLPLEACTAVRRDS